MATPWSKTAHAFAHHQLAIVSAFWQHGRPADYRLEVRAGGQAYLHVTFPLPRPGAQVPLPYLYITS